MSTNGSSGDFFLVTIFDHVLCCAVQCSKFGFLCQSLLVQKDDWWSVYIWYIWFPLFWCASRSTLLLLSVLTIFQPSVKLCYVTFVFCQFTIYLLNEIISNFIDWLMYFDQYWNSTRWLIFFCCFVVHPWSDGEYVVFREASILMIMREMYLKISFQFIKGILHDLFLNFQYPSRIQIFFSSPYFWLTWVLMWFDKNQNVYQNELIFI